MPLPQGPYSPRRGLFSLTQLPRLPLPAEAHLRFREKVILPRVAKNYTLAALLISSSFKCWLWPKLL